MRLLGGVSEQFKKSKKILKEKPAFGDELPLVRPPQKQPIGGLKFSQNMGLPVLDKKPTTTAGKESRNTSRQRSKGRLTPQHQVRGSADVKPIFQSAKTADVREQVLDLGSADLSTNPTTETPTSSSMTGKSNLKFGAAKGWSKRDALPTPQPEYGDDELRAPGRNNGTTTGKSLPRLGARGVGASASAIVTQKRESSRPDPKEKQPVGRQNPGHTAKVLLSGLRGKDQQHQQEELDKKKPKPKAQGAVESVSNMVLQSMCAKSQAGFSEGKTKTNQDANFHSISLKASPNCALFGVFDGHGLQGHKVSAFIKQHLKSRSGSDFRQFGQKV